LWFFKVRHPGLLCAEHLGVRRAVNVVLQIFGGFPNGEVVKEVLWFKWGEIVFKNAECIRSCLRAVESPDEAGAAFGQLVHFINAGDELGHGGIAGSGSHAGDIYLSKVMAHEQSLYDLNYFSNLEVAASVKVVNLSDHPTNVAMKITLINPPGLRRKFGLM
jgi:hypothetical protein